jgi:hypothetical protein
LNIFVALFKKYFKTAKTSKWTAFSWAVAFFLNVFNILKPLSFEGSFHLKKRKKSAGAKSGELGGWLSPQHHVWIEKSSLLVQNWDIIVQQEPTALCSKLWPHPENALQQSSDNLNVHSTIDCPSGTNSLWATPWLSKNVINTVLMVDFSKQNFLGLGDDFEDHCML